MKTVTCANLGGPATCTFVVTGTTTEEMGKHCQNHVMEMVQAGDAPHQAAIDAMQALPQEQQQAKFKEFMSVCESALNEDNV